MLATTLLLQVPNRHSRINKLEGNLARNRSKSSLNSSKILPRITTPKPVTIDSKYLDTMQIVYRSSALGRQEIALPFVMCAAFRVSQNAVVVQNSSMHMGTGAGGKIQIG